MKAMNTAAFAVLIGQLRSCYTHGKGDDSRKIPPPITKRVDVSSRVRGPFPMVRMSTRIFGAALRFQSSCEWMPTQARCESHKIFRLWKQLLLNVRLLQKLLRLGSYDRANVLSSLRLYQGYGCGTSGQIRLSPSDLKEVKRKWGPLGWVSIMIQSFLKITNELER